MPTSPRILLTNDDGIDATGFQALYDALSAVGDVVAVAPAYDQSSVGRQLSATVPVREHDLGYVIEGTPADCVVTGLQALVSDVDLVVAGCNEGANLGAYTLGRSGTVSAAVESAFFDIPAIAVSMYIPFSEDTSLGEVSVAREEFASAIRATTYLAEHAQDAGVFEQAEYLNVNAPVADDATGKMVITNPSHEYRLDATRDGEEIQLHDRIWGLMTKEDLPDPEGTDRRAVVEGHVSVSPLTAPHTTHHHEALDAIAETYPGAVD